MRGRQDQGRLDAARLLVRSRSHGMCEGCGAFGHPLDPHHRQARGSGGVYGSAAVVANDVRNLLALCRTCHDLTEHGEHWQECEGKGWRIPHFVEDPRVVPALLVTVNGRGWYLLTEDGGYRWIDLDSTHRLEHGSPE